MSSKTFPKFTFLSDDKKWDNSQNKYVQSPFDERRKLYFLIEKLSTYEFCKSLSQIEEQISLWRNEYSQYFEDILVHVEVFYEKDEFYLVGSRMETDEEVEERLKESQEALEKFKKNKQLQREEKERQERELYEQLKIKFDRRDKIKEIAND